MTEARAPYTVKLANPPAMPSAYTLEPFDSPTYLQPDPDDVRAVKTLLGMSGSQIASLVGVDSRIVRRWLAVPPAAHTAIPYAPWRLMVMAAGLVPMPLDSGQK